jgi:hypothetical protein
MRLHTPQTWAEVERLYFEGQDSAQGIAKKCGVSPSALMKRAVKLDWPPLGELRLSGVGSERARLRAVIVKKIEWLEKRAMSLEPATDADQASQARVVGSLTNALETLNSKDQAWRKSICTPMPKLAHGPDAKDDGESNVEQWRQDIDRRIRRLRESWNE